MTRRQFETLVEKALPKRFKSKIQNIAVVVEDWADDETLADLGIEPPETLYGLYRGIDLTRRDSSYGNVMPDTITIYQGPIEEDCADEAEMAELVRDTVIDRTQRGRGASVRRGLMESESGNAPTHVRP